jgi:hypothetical protein
MHAVGPKVPAAITRVAADRGDGAMRPLLGFSMVAILVAGCASAGGLPSTGPSVPSAMVSPAPSPAASAASAAVSSPAPSAVASSVASSPPVTEPFSSAAPPAPLDVTWNQTPAQGFGVGTTTMSITWREPLTAGLTIRVYGVTACLNPPGTDNVPCLVVNTSLPANVLTLVATAPAAQGHASWTWPSWGNIGQALAVNGSETYYAFVVGAYTAVGHSKMIIAATADYCSTCTT